MKEVKRYVQSEVYKCMVEVEKGNWVAWEDYEKILQALERSQKILRKILGPFIREENMDGLWEDAKEEREDK